MPALTLTFIFLSFGFACLALSAADLLNLIGLMIIPECLMTAGLVISLQQYQHELSKLNVNAYATLSTAQTARACTLQVLCMLINGCMNPACSVYHVRRVRRSC